MPLLAWLDARDRALFVWLALAAPRASPFRRRCWVAITHLGGARASIAVTLVALAGFLGAAAQDGALPAAVGLALSHLVVHLLKKRCARPRPSRHVGGRALIAEPACFSMPSGHATAAMSLAFVFALHAPAVAPALLALAMLVGLSRVRLGVHYPGDVLAGQGIAILSGLAVVAAL